MPTFNQIHSTHIHLKILLKYLKKISLHEWRSSNHSCKVTTVLHSYWPVISNFINYIYSCASLASSFFKSLSLDFGLRSHLTIASPPHFDIEYLNFFPARIRPPNLNIPFLIQNPFSTLPVSLLVCWQSRPSTTASTVTLPPCNFPPPPTLPPLQLCPIPCTSTTFSKT